MANNAVKKLTRFDALCTRLSIQNLTVEDMRAAAEIYAKLKSYGMLIADGDILIAAQCLTNGYTLITNNISHFERIDGLDIENWTEG